jgi:hypothetical protein
LSAGLVCLALAALNCHAQPSSVPETRFWRTDGPVLAILVTNNTVYLGGQFNYVGPDTGGASVVDAVTGNLRSGFPLINGPVYSAAPDGRGGWYIGGAFSSVGGIVRSNLAHVLADNRVDPLWNPQANGSNVVLRVAGNTVYVGGGFTRIGPTLRNRIAALDAATGQPSAWNPNASAVVTSMQIVGNLLYVGGNFTSIGSSNRLRLAALDLATGRASGWNPGASALVTDLEVVGDTVYVAGTFTSVGGGNGTGSIRNRIAALSATSNAALAWNPNSGGAVLAIAASGNTVYAAGSFANIGNQNRNRVAALDATSGLALDWDPNANDDVRTLELSGNTVFVGGDFTTIAGESRPGLAAIDAAVSAVAPWNPLVSTLAFGGVPQVQLLLVNGNDLLVAGSFNSIGGVARGNLAALSAATGEATGWNPDANSNVLALAYADNLVYVGGLFTNVAGLERRRLAALDAGTGQATGWNPNVLGRAAVGVFALLAADGNRLYVGGNFTNVLSTTRNSLAVFSRSTGGLQGWNPNPGISTANQSPSINALALSGNTLYAGGDFTTNGGQPRLRVAALDATSGNALAAFNPGASNAVAAFALTGNTLYVGGAFTNIGGQVRGRVAALDATTGAVSLTWNPDAGPVAAATRVNALAVANNSVYAGGAFASIGGVFRNRAAGLRASDGQAHDWNPNANAPVRALFRTADAIYLGGEFTTLGGQRHNYFAVFNAQPVFTPGTQERLADGTFRSQVTSGDGVRLLIQFTEDLSAWSEVTTRTDLNGAPITIEDPGAIGRPRRLYRALLETQ